PANVGRHVELRSARLVLRRARVSLPARPSAHQRALARYPRSAPAIVGSNLRLSASAGSLLDQLLRPVCENGTAPGSRRGRFRCAGGFGLARRFLFIPGRWRQTPRSDPLIPPQFRRCARAWWRRAARLPRRGSYLSADIHLARRGRTDQSDDAAGDATAPGLTSYAQRPVSA